MRESPVMPPKDFMTTKGKSLGHSHCTQHSTLRELHLHAHDALKARFPVRKFVRATRSENRNPASWFGSEKSRVKKRFRQPCELA